MGILTKIGCFIIGWKSDILKECGEASHRTFKRYISAIIILSIIWGTIGFCFADRYVGIESLHGKILISLVFTTIIICIERFIILTVGKLGWMGFIRGLLAFLMAVFAIASPCSHNRTCAANDDAQKRRRTLRPTQGRWIPNARNIRCRQRGQERLHLCLGRKHMLPLVGQYNDIVRDIRRGQQ